MLQNNTTNKNQSVFQGTYIIPSLTTVLRDETYFERPEEFYPPHFLTADGQFLRNEAFMPFSAGNILYVNTFRAVKIS